MGLLGFLEKTMDILSAPFEIIGDYAKEPLRKWEYNRQEQSKQKDFDRYAQSSQRDHELRKEEARIGAELDIRRDTEKLRIATEIMMHAKDQEFKRMKATSEEMKKLFQDFTRINLEVVDEIGNLSNELTEKASILIQSRKKKVWELRKEIGDQLRAEVREIERDFDEKDSVKEMFVGNIDQLLAILTEDVRHELKALNDDLARLNSDISLLTSSGQDFIRHHLTQFTKVGISSDQIQEMTGNSSLKELKQNNKLLTRYP